GLPEPAGLERGAEPPRADQVADLDHAAVERVGEDLAQRAEPRLRVLVGDDARADVARARRVERLRRRDRAALEAGRDDERLHDRPRLVRVEERSETQRLRAQALERARVV